MSEKTTMIFNGPVGVIQTQDGAKVTVSDKDESLDDLVKRLWKLVLQADEAKTQEDYDKFREQFKGLLDYSLREREELAFDAGKAKKQSNPHDQYGDPEWIERYETISDWREQSRLKALEELQADAQEMGMYGEAKEK